MAESPLPESPPRELTEEELRKELAGLEKSDLVEMVMAARQAKDDVEKRCVDLGQAFRHAQMSLQQLEEEAEKVHHAQERELGLLFDESLSLRAEMDFDATTMALDNQRMKDELAAYAVVREQNEKFKELLAKMQESAMQTQEKHRKEVEDLRESVGVIKDKLTKEFRARIHKLSGEVSEAMAGAGEHAPQQNQAHHASKLAETESHIKVIMDKYTQLETEHDKVKLAHGLVQQSMEFQTKEMLHRKRELLESRERCASLTHDLHDAKVMIDKQKREIQTVNALREQIYDVEVQQRHLKEQVASNKREALRWKTRALKLKQELKNASASAAREGSKKPGAKGTGYDGGGSVRSGEVLPVVTRGQTGIASRGLDDGRPRAGGTDDDDWDDEDDWEETERGDSWEGSRQQSGMRGKTASQAHMRSGALSTSPTMNFSKVFESARHTSAKVDLPDDDDLDVRRIWSATFASRGVEGGVHMGAGMGEMDGSGNDERSLSAPPNRVDWTRSGSSLGIGNNAQLYLPRGPGMDGRKTDPGKMFQVSQPGAKKKKSNARFLNFI